MLTKGFLMPATIANMYFSPHAYPNCIVQSHLVKLLVGKFIMATEHLQAAADHGYGVHMAYTQISEVIYTPL